MKNPHRSTSITMTLLYTDPRFLEHDTGRHPERALRLQTITTLLDSTGLAAKCAKPTWEPASLERIGRVHDLAYIESIAALAARG
ncbi:MAG TPA: hypothetical protein VGJ26_22565, partial [Pirellulales bacterium]